MIIETSRHSEALGRIRAHAEHARVAFESITAEIACLSEDALEEDVRIVQDVLISLRGPRDIVNNRFNEFLGVREALKDLAVARERRAGSCGCRVPHTGESCTSINHR